MPVDAETLLPAFSGLTELMSGELGAEELADATARQAFHEAGLPVDTRSMLKKELFTMFVQRGLGFT